MEIDEKTWKFPVDQLSVEKAALCLIRQDEQIISIGFRIECESIKLPDINYGYEEENEEKPEISISLSFPFNSLESLASQKADLGEPVETCGEDLGSVYLFGAHNPVGWQSIEFGSIIDGRVEVTFDLYFDFKFEDRIGGCFRHTMKAMVEVEKRWEL